MATLKILAALLHYPNEALQKHADELTEALRAEQLLTGERCEAVAGFIAWLRDSDLLDLQAEYVETFDRGRSRSLYLYEHVHGESRERGPAMVELAQVYRAHGFEIATVELPDYLPLVFGISSQLAAGRSPRLAGRNRPCTAGTARPPDRAQQSLCRDHGTAGASRGTGAGRCRATAGCKGGARRYARSAGSRLGGRAGYLRTGGRVRHELNR
jgi:nitrate reductase molybdenum cofactor assembly chaperone